MSNETDWMRGIGNLLSGIAATASFVALYLASRAKKSASVAGTSADEAKKEAGHALDEAQRAMAQAQVGWLELQLRVYLSSRRDKIQEATRDLEAVTAGRAPEAMTPIDKGRLREVKLRWESAHEDFLGALEQACRFFRDGKVDRDAFRRMYDDEVRRAVESARAAGHPFHSMLLPRDTSRFKALWAVYSEWFDLEKK